MKQIWHLEIEKLKKISMEYSRHTRLLFRTMILQSHRRRGQALWEHMPPILTKASWETTMKTGSRSSQTYCRLSQEQILTLQSGHDVRTLVYMTVMEEAYVQTFWGTTCTRMWSLNNAFQQILKRQSLKDLQKQRKPLLTMSMTHPKTLCAIKVALVL